MAWLTATYLISSDPQTIRERAQALALEQSVELPLAAVRSQAIRDSIVARVASIEPDPADPSRFRVDLQLAVATTGGEVTQLVNMIFGNCSLQPDVELENVELPAGLLERFNGPRLGIEGLRELTGAHGRPLTCSALKPQGSSPDELAALCETFARAGIDVVKDDHGLANQSYAPFAQRVRACQAAVARARASDGSKTTYAPSIVGTPRKLAEQAQIALDAGVQMVLMAPMLVGIPAFLEFTEQFPQLAVLAHPAFGGAGRIKPPWLFGRFFRLLGADAIIFPNHGGRFSYDRATCVELAGAARAPWNGIRPALPVPAGGMPLDRIGEIVELYGEDVMLLIGGALLSGDDAVSERSREFARAIGVRA